MSKLLLWLHSTMSINVIMDSYESPVQLNYDATMFAFHLPCSKILFISFNLLLRLRMVQLA